MRKINELKTPYVSPEVKTVETQPQGVICESVGGQTGQYDPTGDTEGWFNQ